MSQRVRSFLRKAQILLIIACGTLPVGLVLFCFYGRPMVPYAWVFPCGYLAASLVALAIRGKWRLIYGIAVALLAVTCTGLSAPAGCLISALGIGIFYAVAFLWSLRIGGWTQENELSAFWGCFCVAAHLIGQLVLFANKNMNDPILEPWAFWMLASFFVFAVLTLLSMNRLSLSDAAGNRQGISGLIRQKNILMTLGLFLLALLVCLVPTAVKAVGTLLSWIFAALRALFLFLLGKGAGYGPGNAVSQPVDTSVSEPVSQANPLAVVINLITLAAGAVLTLLLALYLLRSLYRKLKVWLPRLLASLNRFAIAATEDYEDEITDTRVQGETAVIRRQRSRRKREKELRKLPPKQRIRHRYLRLVQKHPEWASSATARENLPQALASLYERARYSDHPVTEDEAGAFVTGSRQI